MFDGTSSFSQASRLSLTRDVFMNCLSWKEPVRLNPNSNPNANVSNAGQKQRDSEVKFSDARD